MDSPSKRRKKNDSKPAVVQHRSLDFFFRKQSEQPEKTTDRTGQNGDTVAPGQLVLDNDQSTSENALTDEELARRLQEEWAREDGEGSSQHVPSNRPEDTKHKTEEDVKAFVSTALDHSEPVTEVAQNHAGTKKGVLGLQSTASEEDTITLSIPFDQSPLTFDPSQYVSELKRHWAADGGDASYALLTRCFFLVNSTQSRIKIVDTLVNCLRVLIEADPESLVPAVWLATNSISPPYISLELGLGGSAISKALKKVCGLDNAGLKSLYDKHGDAGDVAFEAKKRQSFTLRKPKPLTIKGAYQTLVKIANSKGHGSVEQKQRLVERLLQDARGPEESRYIVRTLVQHLRIGAVKTTMLIALARAFQLSRPPGADFPVRDATELARLKKDELAIVWGKAEEVVKTCFARRPNYNDLVPGLLEVGVSEELLLRCNLALHVPLRPMLGSITRDLSEMLTKLQGRDFSCEFKYDGQRAQVHCDERGKVSIFSRHLEVMTDKYPDLVALVPEIRGDGVSSFILEGEVVAVDRNSGELKTFQTLTNRAKKDVDIDSIQIDVCLFAFDLMYLNGEPLLDRPFRERRALLRSMFVEKEHHFTWVRSIDATSADSETVLEFFKSATDIKCEGIMVKVLDNLANPDLGVPAGSEAEGDDTTNNTSVTTTMPITPSKKGKKSSTNNINNKKTQLDKEQEKEKGTRRKALLATYEPDKRLDSWLKVKKDYATSADTIDLIPVAGWHGSGRKAKWWSPILLACRNPETGSLEVVTKCISGFTDKFYQANKDKYAEGGDNVLGSRPSYIEYSGPEPDVWFEPQEVWEMAFADITLSPTYTAAIGLVNEDRGLSMRFPRFLKVRDDKGIEEASTNEFLAALYRKQEARIKETGQVVQTTGAAAVVEGDALGPADEDEDHDDDLDE
ncbi:DNA ligase 1 [Capronia coronata CBS 617.96]|uniref:DNA ligase n=1 Tax=Capronia coronata CBS 617.96 TaxID=1182541 RepID=W9Y2S9_9EURO|nr:DNA ligase 1 [Capronia coronata CBS 617.96]EXJ83536.1 DNA ligase 1 [Capronia coronata CBS 617.96]